MLTETGAQGKVKVVFKPRIVFHDKSPNSYTHLTIRIKRNQSYPPPTLKIRSRYNTKHHFKFSILFDES